MRWLIGVVMAALLLWCGYWFVGSTALQRGAERWFAEAPARGLVAEKAGLQVRGFPSRFDLTVEGVHIADPARGIDWQAPFAQLLMMSWKPWHMIAALPNDQSLTLPSGRYVIRSQKMMGSLVVVPGADLALDRMRAEVTAPNVLGPDGEVWQAAEAHLATERQAAAPDNGQTDAAVADSHRIGVEVTGLMLPAGVAARTGMPATVPLLRMDAVAGFSAPIDRHLRETRPALVRLHLSELRLEWGEITATGSGDLSADPQGLAEGKLTFRIQNWRAALTAAEAAGVIDARNARTLERGLRVMALASGDPEVLELPVTFANGEARSGFIPLGPAPRLN